MKQEKQTSRQPNYGKAIDLSSLSPMLANTAYSTACIMMKDSTRMSKATKKGFLKYLSGKRKAKMWVCCWGGQGKQDMEKSEILNAFFASVLTSKTRF